MKIALIGAGNVATHLGKKLVDQGEEVLQVFSRQMARAAELAAMLNAEPIDDLAKLTTQAALYLIAVHDDAIEGILLKTGGILVKDKLVVHTSGSKTEKVFEVVPEVKRTGVFYPLQTFTKGRRPDFSVIPICIQAAQDEDLTLLEALASKVSGHVYNVTDEQRVWLHLAAVFVNNFTNHLFTIGQEILDGQRLPFEILKPLIQETAAKLESGQPKAMQTGPAVRHDWMTVERHLIMLNGRDDLQKIYEIMTNHIKITHADNRKH